MDIDHIDHIEQKQVAVEWDMSWFCHKCEIAVHWKIKAYVFNNHYYCRNCMNEIIDNYNNYNSVGRRNIK